jgi:hypothetical protein
MIGTFEQDPQKINHVRSRIFSSSLSSRAIIFLFLFGIRVWLSWADVPEAPWSVVDRLGWIANVTDETGGPRTDRGCRGFLFSLAATDNRDSPSTGIRSPRNSPTSFAPSQTPIAPELAGPEEIDWLVGATTVKRLRWNNISQKRGKALGMNGGGTHFLPHQGEGTLSGGAAQRDSSTGIPRNIE